MQFLLLAWITEEAVLPVIEHQPTQWDHHLYHRLYHHLCNHQHQRFCIIVIDIITVDVIIVVNTIIGEVIIGDIIIVVIITDLLHKSGQSRSLVCARDKEIVRTNAVEGKIHLCRDFDGVFDGTQRNGEDQGHGRKDTPV